MSFFTPLRYPGGKGRMGPWIAELMRHNKISGGWYVEPYAGGCGAALFLLIHGYVDRIVINDADSVIYAFWKAVTEQNGELIAKIKSTRVTMAAWRKQREILQNHSAHTQIDVAFASFFLNRTNRSGIVKGAGVIGGLNQDGNYKIDCRFNRVQDPLGGFRHLPIDGDVPNLIRYRIPRPSSDTDLVTHLVLLKPNSARIFSNTSLANRPPPWITLLRT